jgi:hypothetical protein
MTVEGLDEDSMTGLAQCSDLLTGSSHLHPSLLVQSSLRLVCPAYLSPVDARGCCQVALVAFQ